MESTWRGARAISRIAPLTNARVGECDDALDARDVRVVAAMSTSARIERAVVSRASSAARRNPSKAVPAYSCIDVSGRPCYLSHSAADERARGYVRQRSRRSGRARCRVDVSGRARGARGRFSCVRCGTARSEPGRLGLQFGKSNGGGDVSERRRGRRAASAISVSSLITRSSSASM